MTQRIRCGLHLRAGSAASLGCLAALALLSCTSGRKTVGEKPPVVNAPSRIPPAASWVGVNLACGEFGKVPGVFDRDYTYPGERQFAWCREKGFLVARLPLKWERVQRELMGPLDPTEMGRLDAVVGHARTHGVQLLLDVHDYARYGGKLIGTTDVSNEAFADLWLKLASHYRDEGAIFAYGLMNEPHDTNGLWPAAAQAAVDAIRSVDGTHTILACGDGWSGAHSWKKANGDFLLRDPADNLVYEAHQYFDRDNSGSYKQSYDDSGAHPAIGVERLRPFAEWLKEHNARGFIGEFGVPGDDARWLVVLDNFLAAMTAEGIGGTYWAAGPWWGKYPLSVEPKDGKERPQLAVLRQYAVGGNLLAEKPWSAAATAAEEAARERKAASQGQDTAPTATKDPSEHVVYDLGVHKESYHYSNEGSEFASEAAEDQGRKVRRIAYRHRGGIAWIGVGLYFGSLDCSGHTGFSLEIRSEKPCRLEVKAYHADNDRYSATFDVGAEWQTLSIPFNRLRRDKKTFDAGGKLLKIEFQPNPDHSGNQIWLGRFRLVNGD